MYLYLFASGFIAAFGDPPTILWTECPSDYVCDKCLNVIFVSEEDFACLNQKWPGNDCAYEGFFLNEQDTRVAVSSEQCVIDGNMDNIQVLTYLRYIRLLESGINVGYKHFSDFFVL